MTDIQAQTQCDGPHRPTPGALAAMLDTLPRHYEIRAISIRGQGGGVFIETYHEGAEETFTFNSPES